MIELVNTIQNQKNDFENIANEKEATQYVLREYKRVCDLHDFDYEFNTIDDIKNNEGSLEELKGFFNRATLTLDIAD